MPQDAKETARMMIRLHGLQAQAVAQQHVSEMRHQGNTAGLDHWQHVHTAICEMRQAGHTAEFGEHHADHRS